jgi:hypothetical protein
MQHPVIDYRQPDTSPKRRLDRGNVIAVAIAVGFVVALFAICFIWKATHC